MGSTQDVLENHLNSFKEGDLKGILSDYAPGAVLFTPDGPLRGPEAIKSFFIRLLAEFGKPGAVFSMEAQFVEGEYGYILWTAETPITSTSSARTPSSCEMARSRFNHSPARPRRRTEEPSCAGP
jgi:ketosteroid isomerase-like protein